MWEDEAEASLRTVLFRTSTPLIFISPAVAAAAMEREIVIIASHSALFRELSLVQGWSGVYNGVLS